MSTPVLTPITQALADGTLSRGELKALMQRSNGPAFRHLAVWVLVLLCTSLLLMCIYVIRNPLIKRLGPDQGLI